jgi:indole-3-glycerol phosphate synthase
MSTTIRGTLETGTILDTIIARTSADVKTRKTLVPEQELERQAEMAAPAISLHEALRQTGLSLIAEIKRASPSKGRFPVEFEVADVAESYRTSGANAISVLTDEPFFQGSLADLSQTVSIAHAGIEPIPVWR